MPFDVLFENRYLLGVIKVSSHAHKTGPWYLLAVLFSISNEHPSPFHRRVPTPRILSSIPGSSYQDSIVFTSNASSKGIHFN